MVKKNFAGFLCTQIVKRNKEKDMGYFERALISKTTNKVYV
jgi:hypothetical protein